MTRVLMNLIDGTAVAPATDLLLPVVDPPTETKLARVPDSPAGDVERAVHAARGALRDWSALPSAARAALLSDLADALEQDRAEVVGLVVSDLGAPLKTAEQIHVDLPISVLRQTAGLADLPDREEVIGNSRVIREPVGVVAAITPWNYPLHQTIGKIAPALLAGCTIVLKPSEVVPLAVDRLAQLTQSVGFPPGVLNVVWGTGPGAGKALSSHPGVDFVSFTGSTSAGCQVAAAAGANAIPTALELGGKSASVVLRGADLTRAVKLTVASCFLNAGQTCNATTRLLVPVELADEVTTIATESAAKYTVGDPRDPAVRLGPLVSATQQERVIGMIRRAEQDGAVAVLDGSRRPAEGGYFVGPTVLTSVSPGSHMDQNEVFGPVLSILTYGTAEEAIAIANGTPYGLAATVWGEQDEALAVARRIDAGMVDLNGGRYNSLAPFGGVKKSGYGREFGAFGVEEFLRVKSLQL